MAGFESDLSGPQGAGASVLHPVQSRFESPMVGLGLGLASIFAQNMQEQKKLDKAAADQAVINEFVTSQNALNDASNQGVDPARITSMARANFAKYAANYPHLVEEFNKSNKVLFESTDLGQDKMIEQRNQDELKTLRADFIKSGGFIPDGASPQLVNTMLTNFQQTRADTEAFQRKAARNAEARAQEGADRSRVDWDTKQSASQLLVSIGASQLPVSQQFIMETVNKAKKGDVEGAINDLNIHFANIEGAIAAASASNPELAGSWRTLFDGIKKSGMDAIEGKVSTDVLKQQLETTLTKGKLAALQDKDMLAVTVTSQLLGGQLPELFWNANNAAKNAILRLGNTNDPDKAPQVVGDKDTEKATFALVEHNMRMLSTGSAENPEVLKTQMSNVANNILHQVDKASESGIPPEKLAQTAEFLASPTYAKMVDAKMIDPRAAQGAHKVMQVYYEKNVSKAVEKKLEEPVIVSPEGKSLPLSNYVDFTWNGAGVQISKLHNTNLSLQETKDINMAMYSLKPSEKYINQLIRIGAHMEGHTNYAQYWEENKQRILPSYMPDADMLKVGQVVNGYRYIGGNTRNPSNWEKVQGDSAK